MPPSPPFPISFGPLMQEWADEVSDILYAVRDWVYLTPEAPREKPHKEALHPQPQSDRFSRDDHRQSSREGCGGAADGADPPRGVRRGERCSAWARGRRHVQEWARFLWRVSRPGVPPEFPMDSLRQECGATRNHFSSVGRRSNACGSCAARRKAERRSAAAAAGAAAG